MASSQALKNKKLNNERADLAAATVDMLDVGAIFSMFMNETLRAFFEQTGKFIFFPVAAAMNLTRAGLSIREAHLKKWKARPIVKMAIETVSALAVTAAVAGAIALPLTFALIAPAIFVGVLGFKTLFNLGASVYYLGKSAAATDDHHKQKNLKLGISHGAISVAIGLAAVGVASVFIFGHMGLAAMAVAGGLMGAVTAGVKFFRTFGHKPKADAGLAAVNEAEAAPAAPAPQQQSSSGLLAKFFHKSAPATSAEPKATVTVDHKEEDSAPLSYEAIEASQVKVSGGIDLGSIKENYEPAGGAKTEVYERPQML